MRAIARDFDRWAQRRVEGLVDETAPGNPPRITGAMRDFMRSKLSEDRTWNAKQLAEDLEEFGLAVTPEAVRQPFSWAKGGWRAIPVTGALET